MKLIDELKARGLVAALTDPEIETALERPMTIYCGFDPSARSLQAGNLVSIMVLKRLQLAGHKVIALVGGATGLIGDPSGKSVERNMLTVEQVEENKKGIRENLARVLDFDGPNAAILVDNYDWYKGTSAIEFLRDIAINFRVPQMLAKESVKKRLEASEPPEARQDGHLRRCLSHAKQGPPDSAAPLPRAIQKSRSRTRHP